MIFCGFEEMSCPGEVHVTPFDNTSSTYSVFLYPSIALASPAAVVVRVAGRVAADTVFLLQVDSVVCSRGSAPNEAGSKVRSNCIRDPVNTVCVFCSGYRKKLGYRVVILHVRWSDTLMPGVVLFPQYWGY